MKLINLGADTSGRPLVIDDRTEAKLRLAEANLGFKFTIVQGSYRGGKGAAASAGTHDGGGVIDLRTWNLPLSIAPQEAVRALREAGFIAWYRHEGQGFDPHIHAIDYGNPSLAPGAAAQVEMYEQGFNGLASWGEDDGPRVNIPKAPPKEEDMPLNDNDIDRLAAAVWAKEIGGGDNRRAARMHLLWASNASREAARKVRHNIDQIRASINALPEGATKDEVADLLSDLDATIQLVIKDEAQGE